MSSSSPAAAGAPVAPVAAHQLMIFLLQVGLLLALALALGRLAVRLRMPAVVGELTAGVLMGPSLLDHLVPGFAGWLLPKDAGQFHLLDAFGQVGVVLLVGITGAQMDLGLVRRRWSAAAGASLGGLVVPFASGAAIGYLLPGSLRGAGTDRTVFALMLGVVMCVSALPVISKTLIDMNLLHRNVGQLTLAAGTLDDVAGWLMLSVVSAMATTGLGPGTVLTSIGTLLAVVAGLAVLGRPLVLVTMRFIDQRRDTGPAVAAVCVFVLLAAALTQAVRLEAVFGAFMAGIVVASCRGAATLWLPPLRTAVLAVFAPVFFASAGLRMDLTALRRPAALGTAALVLSVAVAGKFAGVYLGARLRRLTHWEALALGAGMNARGAIEVIVAMVGLRLGILTTEAYTTVVIVAVVTSLMAPPILRVTMRRVERTADERLRREDYGVDGPVSGEEPELAS